MNPADGWSCIKELQWKGAYKKANSYSWVGIESVRNWWFSQCRHYFLVKFNCLMPANGNGSLCINP